MIDWLESFYSAFKQFKEIRTLRADGFHGSLTLHFCDGVVHSYDLSLHRRAKVA